MLPALAVGRLLLLSAARAPRARSLCAAPPLGQDLGEQFELYAEPAGPLDTPCAAAPQPLSVRKARGDVHRDGDWHRSVHVWLSDSSGERVVVQKRSEFKDTHPGRWDVSCAGHITAGDGSVGTAVKELEEELGVTLAEEVLASARLCTLPAEARGATASHGEFVCREFQDLYLLRLAALDGAGGLAGVLGALGADEVAAAELRPASDVLAAWAGGADADAYVPRRAGYRAVLREALAGGRGRRVLVAPSLLRRSGWAGS